MISCKVFFIVVLWAFTCWFSTWSQNHQPLNLIHDKPTNFLAICLQLKKNQHDKISLLFKCCLQVQLSFTISLHCCKLQQLISSELLIPYSSPSVSHLLHISYLMVVLQLPSFWSCKAKFSFFMLTLFICNFCKFKWWHCVHLAIPNIDASFINLFQMYSLSSCFCCSLVFF